MMMSAMRRPKSHDGRARKGSGKAKRRARLSSQGEESGREEASPSHQPSQPSQPSQPDVGSERPRSSRSSLRKRSESCRQGDMGDSGIDSGNGIADPDSPPVTSDRPRARPEDPAPCASSDAKSTPPTSGRHGDDGGSRSGERSGVSSAPPAEETVSGRPPSSRRRSKSRHRTDRASSDCGDGGEDRGAGQGVEPELSTAASQRDSHQVQSTDTPVTADTKDDSTQHNTSRNVEPSLASGGTEGGQTNEVGVTGSGGHVTETAPSGESRARLEDRLERAKRKMASPHVDTAVDSFELLEGPVVAPPNTSLLQDFRQLFRHELTRLRGELDDFRAFCCQQMEREASLLLEKRQGVQKDLQHSGGADGAPSPKEQQPQQQQQEQKAKDEKTAGALDEDVIQAREDELAARLKDLQEYEKEILEVEGMLNQRQAICERRQAALLTLDQELQSLREDIFDKKEDVRREDDTSEERAKKNWDLVRRHLTDRQAMLEAAVQRYRTQVASNEASLAAKDSLVAHLRKQLKDAQDECSRREKRAANLESKLVLASQEVHAMHTTAHPDGSLPRQGHDPPGPGRSHSGRRASIAPQTGAITAEPPSRSLTRQHSRMSGGRPEGSNSAYRTDRRASSVYRPDRPGSTSGHVDDDDFRPPTAAMSRRASRHQRARAASRASASEGEGKEDGSAACTIL